MIHWKPGRGLICNVGLLRGRMWRPGLVAGVLLLAVGGCSGSDDSSPSGSFQEDAVHIGSVGSHVRAISTERDAAWVAVAAKARIQLYPNPGVGQGKAFPVYPDDNAIAVALVPPKSQLLSAHYVSETLILWDMTTHKPAAQRRFSRTVCDMAVSADGQTAAVFVTNGSIVLVRLPSLEPARTIQAHRYDARRQVPTHGMLGWLGRTHRLVSYATDGGLHVWDADSGDKVVSRTDLTGHPMGFAVSTDGKRIALARTKEGTTDQQVLVIEAADLKQVCDVGSHADWPGPVAFSSDGAELAVACGKAGYPEAEFFSVPEGKKLGEVKLPLTPVVDLSLRATAMRYVARGKQLAIGYNDGMFVVFAKKEKKK